MKEYYYINRELIATADKLFDAMCEFILCDSA